MRPLLPLLLAGTAASTLPLDAAGPAAAPADPPDAAYPAIERFVEALELARSRHPDLDRLAYDRLVNHAIDGMLRSLDRHSSFLHPHASYDPGELELPARIETLGLTLDATPDGWRIAAVEDHGPAAIAGSRPGDRLLAVGELPIASQPPAEIIELLDGAAGSRLDLRVSTDGQEPRTLAITRRAPDDRAVAGARVLDGIDPPTGYLRLAEFTTRSPRELEAALDQLEDSGIKRLLLDLRGNPGGDLEATVEILGLFLPPATAVVTTRERTPAENHEPMLTPQRQRRKRDYPLAVLIDRDSASASELTAGTLQDLQRATVVGETSYGKGSVQQILPLGQSTAVRLTIATYHTPSGRTPHGQGISPDRPVDSSDNDRRLAALARHPDAATPQQRAELDRWSDPVIQAALAALDEIATR